MPEDAHRLLARFGLATLLMLAGSAHAADPRPRDGEPVLLEAPMRVGRGSDAGVGGPGNALVRLTGVWVEGPGYDVTYGHTYDSCSARCLATSRCIMIEFYRPEKKCNLYNAVRPRRPGGSSVVGIREGRAAR